MLLLLEIVLCCVILTTRLQAKLHFVRFFFYKTCSKIFVEYGDGAIANMLIVYKNETLPPIHHIFSFALPYPFVFDIQLDTLDVKHI